MNTRMISILIGIFFTVSGIVTVLDGIYNMRASNLLIGIAFVVVGSLYLVKRRKHQ